MAQLVRQDSNLRASDISFFFTTYLKTLYKDFYFDKFLPYQWRQRDQFLLALIHILFLLLSVKRATSPVLGRGSLIWDLCSKE